MCVCVYIYREFRVLEFGYQKNLIQEVLFYTRRVLRNKRR
nr:MAG TPA: hypothetical protein [Bacteriophage sp.]